MHAILGPLVGRPVSYRVGADGQMLWLKNGDALWRAIEQDLSAAAKRAGPGDGQSVDALLTQLTPLQREDLLSADIRQMLRFAGRDWTAEYMVADPATVVANCDQIALIGKAAPLPAAALIESRRHWQVDRATGLVRQYDDDQWLRRGQESAPERGAMTRRILMPER